MINVEDLKMQIENYRKDLTATAENRDKMIQMVNQQETKLQQLLGAISALETALSKNTEKAQNAGNENNTTNPEGIVAS